MWHEARKQEKKIKGMMVDYKKRAERRRDFYESIRKDPAQFLQVHGRSMKVHADASIYQAAENCLMPWCNDKNNLIDRFDGRAHLDDLPEPTEADKQERQKERESQLERNMSYERWKNLVQSEFLNIPESKVLHSIYLEERLGTTTKQMATVKKKPEKKAAIGYKYEDDEEPKFNPVKIKNQGDEQESSSTSSDEDEDMDYDTSVDIDKLSHEQGAKINSISQRYGMKSDDFIRHLEEDKAEAERIRIAKEMENEKSMFTGRKSRRERKALKERKMLILRATAPVEQPTGDKPADEESSSSESDTPVVSNRVEFITCFGESSEDEKPPPEIKPVVVKDNKLKNLKKKMEIEDKSTANESAVVFGPSLPVEYFRRSTPEKSSQSSSFKSRSSHRSSRTYSSRRRSRSRSSSTDMFGRSRKQSPSEIYNSGRSRRSRSRSHSRRRTRSRSRSRSRTRRSRSRSRDRRTRRSYRGDSSERSRYRDRSDRRRSRTRSRSRDRDRDSKRRRSRSRDRRGRDSRERRRSRERSREKERTKDRKRSPKPSADIKPKIDIAKPRAETPTKLIEKEKFIPLAEAEPVKPAAPLLEKAPESLIFETSKAIIKSEGIKSEATTLPATIPIPPKPPSPPLKRYYRHDLDGSASEGDSDHSQPQNSNANSQKPALNVSSASESTVAKESSSSKSKHQSLLMKRSRATIDKLYKRDKEAEKEKIAKQAQDDDYRGSRSHRHSRSSSSSRSSRSRSRSWSSSD